MKQFSERLVYLRTKKKISRQQMADSLGISRAGLEFYEKRQRVPNIKVLVRMAKYLNVSTDYLLGLSDVETPDTDLRSVCEYTGLSQKSVETLHFAKMVKSSLSPVMAAMVNAVTGDDVLRELQEIKKHPPERQL